jgi:hypothetical protein
MFSAVMAHFSGAMYRRLVAIIVCSYRGFGARPFVKGREKADDILGDLPGVLATEVTPEARLPQGNSLIDKVVVRWG